MAWEKIKGRRWKFALYIRRGLWELEDMPRQARLEVQEGFMVPPKMASSNGSKILTSNDLFGSKS